MCRSTTSHELIQQRIFIGGLNRTDTGGGSGFGLGMATCFAHAGGDVGIVGRNEDILRQVVFQLECRARYIVHDVTLLDQAHASIEKAGEIRIGGKDVGVI